jgi:hypothetical protein
MQDLGRRVEDVEMRDGCLGVSGFGFRVQGLGFVVGG